MGDEYRHLVGDGYRKLVRRSARPEDEAGQPQVVKRFGGGSNVGRTGVSTAGRVQRTFSPRSRRNMRQLMLSLPWDQLGNRPVFVTLTFPADWRQWCPDSRSLQKKRKAFLEAWARKWGRPVGVWVIEFQPRLRRPPAQQRAPHVHMYLALPERVGTDEYRALVKRTMKRRRMEREIGKFQARRRTRAPEGEFSSWALETWWRIVGSGERSHRFRGVDITACFWSDHAAATMDRTVLAEYFWRESGKWGQKEPPEDFGGLKFYGAIGPGFDPVVNEAAVSEGAFFEMRRAYRKIISVKERNWRQGGQGDRQKWKRTRGHDGLTVYMRNARERASEFEEWAQALAAEKARTWAERQEVEDRAAYERYVRWCSRQARYLVHPSTGEVVELPIDPEPYFWWRKSGPRGFHLRERARRYGVPIAELLGSEP